MEFTLTMSPERAKLLHDNLVIEITGYEDRIRELQALRQEAVNQLAEVKTVLMNNGYKPIEIKHLPAPAPAPTPAPENAGAATKDTPVEPALTASGLTYKKSWSLRDKIVYLFLVEGGKPQWTSDEIRDKLYSVEKDIEKMKTLSTTMVQNTGKVFERINKNGSKPLYKLMKGAQILERYRNRINS